MDGDANDGPDVFLRDRWTGITSRVTLSTTGADPDGRVHYEVAISGDGRHVGFSSDASNLVPTDANGAIDIFVRSQRR